MFPSACGSDEEDYDDEAYATEESAVEVPAAESAPGEVVYDLGFTPQENGFSFENYGDDCTLTPTC